MINIVLFLFQSFQEYYGISTSLMECFSVRKSQIDSNFNIENCNFFKMIFNGIGGVIYFKNDLNFKILIELCIFSQCESTQAGAIFITCINSDIITSKLCGYKCYSSSSSQFSYIETKIGQRNECYYCSILKCSYLEKIGHSVPTYFIRGNLILNNFNYSKCNTLYHCCLVITSGGNSNLNFGTIFQNSPNNFNVIDVYFNLVNFYYINFIGNSSPNNYGIIYVNNNGIIKIFNSIFRENLNVLFYIYSGSISINNCFINHSNIGTLIELNNNSFILTLPLNNIHLFTYFCEALNPFKLNSLNLKINKLKLIKFLIKLILI